MPWAVRQRSMYFFLLPYDCQRRAVRTCPRSTMTISTDCHRHQVFRRHLLVSLIAGPSDWTLVGGPDDTLASRLGSTLVRGCRLRFAPSAARSTSLHFFAAPYSLAETSRRKSCTGRKRRHETCRRQHCWRTCRKL